MAEGKKSFIAYSDWSDTFKAVPDEIAGQLIKYIFSYVNDEEPEPHENFVVNALFQQIKATLKRDLDKWDKQRKQRSEAGKKSAKQRATKFNERSTSVNEKKRKPTVNDNVSVSVSVNDISTNVDNDKSDDVLFTVEKLRDKYLQDERIVKSVCEQNKITKEFLENRLAQFNKHLESSGIYSKKWSDYTKHFLNWNKKAPTKESSKEDYHASLKRNIVF
mgnify:CR=1 FL=1